METQIITIPVRTNIDPAQLLDIALDLAERLAGEIESYGEEAEIDEDEVSVQQAD